jgi:uncharacterized protein
MKRILITAALIGALSTPAAACSDERWNYLDVGSAKAYQNAIAAKHYATETDDYLQYFKDATQTYQEWVAALQECVAERLAKNYQ